MKQLLNSLGIGLILLTSLITTPAHAAAARGIQDKVTVIAMTNPDQKFEVAAKLQWNASYKRWDRILVTYNGHPTPPLSHPVWSYLSNMRIPTQAGTKPGENRLYKVFYSQAYCNGLTPLGSGRPMVINFENDTPGTYDQREFFRDWNCPNWNAPGMRQVSIVKGNGGQVMQINLPQGHAGCAERGGDSCAQWKAHIGARLDTLTYSYRIRFAPNFDFAAGGRLPGIGSVVPHLEGTKPNGTNSWSVGAAWRGDGTVGQYVYHMGQPRSSGDYWAWNTGALTPGQWYQVKTTVRVNSPQQSNGSIVTTLNGKTVLSKSGLRFRQTDKLSIERLLFNIYYSGRAPSKANQVYIDDFQLNP
ncbi:polysaccharide lyase [Thiofilum flexile]|uniref:polysaccharide lyase n=1 Tax=Thiofilum flexile TaxID=125627 RepID=UPI00035DB802|nr:hypothetical protein [Thiofilum flexile]